MCPWIGASFSFNSLPSTFPCMINTFSRGMTVISLKPGTNLVIFCSKFFSGPYSQMIQMHTLCLDSFHAYSKGLEMLTRKNLVEGWRCNWHTLNPDSPSIPWRNIIAQLSYNFLRISKRASQCLLNISNIPICLYFASCLSTILFLQAQLKC